MTVKPTSFTLHIPDADIADLRDRLARTRFPDQAPGDAWAYGTDVGYLRQLIDYWRQGRFPFDRLLTFYRFDEIARAFADVHHGDVIKPVLLMDGVQA